MRRCEWILPKFVKLCRQGTDRRREITQKLSGGKEGIRGGGRGVGRDEGEEARERRNA